MNYKKILSAITGITVLATSLAPISASALSTASMTLSGASNTTGSFAVTVYENTGTDTVTGANVVLDFSSAVSGVSYDYSVGPFVAVTPSGAHNAYGEVSGQQPVATVHFTVNSPATVTATVGAASYLKHAGTTIESFTIAGGSADFTYTAPVAAPSQPAASTTTKPKTTSVTAPVSTTPAATTTAPAPASTTKTSQKSSKHTAPQPQHIRSHHAGVVTSTLSALVIVAAAVYWLVFRKRTEVAPVKAYKLNSPSKAKPAAKKKSAARSNTTTAKRKPAAKKTK